MAPFEARKLREAAEKALRALQGAALSVSRAKRLGPRASPVAFVAPQGVLSPARPFEAPSLWRSKGFREAPEPLFIFDGLDFDGDRIINLKEQPYYCDLQLGGVGAA